MRRIALALLGMTLLGAAGGVVLLAMIGGAGCATQVLRSGPLPDGSWRIEHDDCGATVTDIWRVVILSGRHRAVALEAEGDPEPLEVTPRDGGMLSIRTTGGTFDVVLQANGLPATPLRFRRGQATR